jgi:signal peptidase I
MSKVFGRIFNKNKDENEIDNVIDNNVDNKEEVNDVNVNEQTTVMSQDEDNTSDKTESDKIESDKTPEDDSSDAVGDISSDDDEYEYVDDEDFPQRKKRKKKKRKKKKEKTTKDINIVRELLSLIIYIGAVVLLCYFIITFVGCRARVDGHSMNPTLDDNDSLWVDKISYEIGDPKRFDIIIFDYDENTDYVKRIIGLPGETVRIDQDGNIYINGEILEENYGSERIRSTNVGRAGQTIQLGEDEYFVLGDNRNNSSDSRFADVGNVKREDIVGKVRLRIYPFSSIGFIK